MREVNNYDYEYLIRRVRRVTLGVCSCLSNHLGGGGLRVDDANFVEWFAEKQTSVVMEQGSTLCGRSFRSLVGCHSVQQLSGCQS